jgi:hypothetical protein
MCPFKTRLSMDWQAGLCLGDMIVYSLFISSLLCFIGLILFFSALTEHFLEDEEDYKSLIQLYKGAILSAHKHTTEVLSYCLLCSVFTSKL